MPEQTTQQILDALQSLNPRGTCSIDPGAFDAVMASLPRSSRWGEWIFNPNNLTIRHQSRGHEIDLEQINSTAKMLDWIFHYQGRLGPSVADLIAAFAEIFNPCANCCSGGREKPFSGAELARAHRDRLKPQPSRRRSISPGLRYRVLERARFSCQACGAHAQDGAKLHVDHIHPVSKGGTNDLGNLQCLCQACNLGKSDRSPKLSTPFTSGDKGIRLTHWIEQAPVGKSTTYELLKALNITPEKRRVPGSRKPVSVLLPDQRRAMDRLAKLIADGQTIAQATSLTLHV